MAFLSERKNAVVVYEENAQQLLNIYVDLSKETQEKKVPDWKGGKKYEVNEKFIPFKIAKDNGYAWLSNMWPTDAPSASFSTVKKQFPDIVKEAQSKSFLFGGNALTSEHWYHALKFKGQPKKVNAILKEPTAKASKKVNGAFARELTKEEKKLFKKRWVEKGEQLEAMKEVIKLKFDPQENPALVAGLLSTRDKILYEVPFRADKFWVGPPDGKHANMLGKLLMERRQELEWLLAIQKLTQDCWKIISEIWETEWKNAWNVFYPHGGIESITHMIDLYLKQEFAKHLFENLLQFETSKQTNVADFHIDIVGMSLKLYKLHVTNWQPIDSKSKTVLEKWITQHLLCLWRLHILYWDRSLKFVSEKDDLIGVILDGSQILTKNVSSQKQKQAGTTRTQTQGTVASKSLTNLLQMVTDIEQKPLQIDMDIDIDPFDEFWIIREDCSILSNNNKNKDFIKFVKNCLEVCRVWIVQDCRKLLDDGFLTKFYNIKPSLQRFEFHLTDAPITNKDLEILLQVPAQYKYLDIVPESWQKTRKIAPGSSTTELVFSALEFVLLNASGSLKQLETIITSELKTRIETNDKLTSLFQVEWQSLSIGSCWKAKWKPYPIDWPLEHKETKEKWPLFYLKGCASKQKEEKVEFYMPDVLQAWLQHWGVHYPHVLVSLFVFFLSLVFELVLNLF